MLPLRRIQYAAGELQTRLGEAWGATRWQFYWLCALILSFAYERPLAYLTPYDRTNPRLFDLLVLIGALMFMPKIWKRLPLPKPFRIWTMIVAWFCFCALVWAVFLLPWEYGQFSLFGAARYIEGLAAVYMASSIPLNVRRKRFIHGIIVLGGVFIAIYCIPEYIRGDSDIVVRPDLEVNVGEGYIIGPFGGASYFQLAQTSALFFACTLTYFLSFRHKSVRMLGPITAALVAWPLLFCGARTGLGLMIISGVTLFVMLRQIRGALVLLAALSVVLIFIVGSDNVMSYLVSGATIERLLTSEGGINSLEERFSIMSNFSLENYRAGYMLPVIGAGFNVAPLSGGETDYRIDYGIHNIYLFAYEQAGVVGLLLFLWFAVTVMRCLWKTRDQGNLIDVSFANSLLAYFFATLIVGIGGHNFWQGFGSGNFNTCLIIVLLIATKPARVVALGDRRLSPATSWNKPVMLRGHSK
jgi:hypothetical protein